MSDALIGREGGEIGRAEVLIERNRLLYGALPASVAASIVLGAVLAVVQSGQIPTARAVGWFVFISVLALGRLFVARSYEARTEDRGWAGRYESRFTWGAVAQGLGWGLAGILLFPGDVPHQAFLGFVVAGVSAGAIGTLAVSIRTLTMFLVLALVPLGARFLATGSDIPRTMGFLTALFLLFLVLSGRRVGRMLNDNIRLRLLDAHREGAARRAKELLERVGEIARIGGWEWEPEADVVRWSEQIFRLYDRDPGQALSYETAQAAYPEPDRARLREAVGTAVKEQQPYDLELRFRGPDPDVRWVRALGQPVVEGDRVVRLLGTIQDITERKETAERLWTNLNALQRLHAITALTDEPLDQKIRGILELGLDVFGLQRGQVSRIQGSDYTIEHAVGDGAPVGTRFDLGETYCSHVHHAGGPVAFNHAGESLAAHPCYQRFGHEAYLGAPLSIAGEPFGTLGFSSREPRIEPFTEHHFALIQIFAGWIGHEMGRVRAVAELEESEERTRLILQSVGEGIYGLDREGRTTFVNPAAVKILGYAPEQILGRKMHELVHHSTANGEPYPVEQCPTTRSLTEGETVWVVDEVLWSRAGAPIPVEYTSTPVRKGSALVGAVVSFRDITERKEIERLKNEFVSTVSHELRTPLTSIRGSLGLVAGGALGELPERAAEMVGIAARNSERLILLINDILDMEKIESGKLEFVFKPQPIMPLVEQAVEANHAYAAEHGTELVVTGVVDPAVQANVDENRFAQAVTNLLSNACKFTDEGTSVEVAVVARDSTIRIAVTDHGPGIPEEFRDRIFERFSQADASDQRKKGGTGLGLSITRALVERMGGRIWFDTEPGAGTTFTIELPAWTPAQPVQARILVCQADPEAGEAVARMLQEAGWDAEVVRDVEATRDRLSDPGAPCNALLLDLSLPDDEAASLVQWLRSRPELADLPVVGMTAALQHGRLELGGELRVLDWLDKPVGVGSLKAVLARLQAGSGGLPAILHVEDDADLRRTVAAMARGLAAFHPAGSLEAARKALARREYDLVLLDLGLPDGSGWELLPELNALEERPAVVIFSAQSITGEEAARVEAALLKSRTAERDLLATLEQLLGNGPDGSEGS